MVRKTHSTTDFANPKTGYHPNGPNRQGPRTTGRPGVSLPGGSMPLASRPQLRDFLPLAALPLALVAFFFSWAGFGVSPAAAAVADPAHTPSTWSLSQWGSHHSRGSTNSPWRLTAKWR